MDTPPLRPGAPAHAEPPSRQTCAAQAAAQAAASRPTRLWWPTLPRTERARVRWFVAGHVLAVWALLQLAMAFGDGHAPPPFPPSLTPEQRAAALALPGPADGRPALPEPGTAAGAGHAAPAWPGEGPWRPDVDPGRPLDPLDPLEAAR